MASSVPSAAASHAAADESDLDPAAFLQSVRELSERREREDVERFRKLEQEIEQGRQERARRRADRARSISPEKPTSASASTPSRTTTTTARSIASPPPFTPAAASTPVTMEPDVSQPPAPAAEEVPDFQGFGSAKSSKPRPTSTMSPPPTTAAPEETSKQQSATSLARSGTLSWQQRRPTVRVGGPRPQSFAKKEDTPTQQSRPTSSSAQEKEPSRDEIAASLGARDPSWFRQTAERGIGNAAFRRSNEDASQEDTIAAGRRGLPGMSREISTEPANARQASPVPSETTFSSRAGSVRESVASGSRFSTVRSSTSSRPDLKSLIAADQAQEQASPMSADANVEPGKLSREPTVSSTTSHSRMASTLDRPSSPTKGMGGFVQSAMMKRSDSVSKRGTPQSGSSAGVSRHNSIMSNISGQGGIAGSRSMPRLEPSGSKESSAEPASRPVSRDSNASDVTATTTTTTTTARARDDNDDGDGVFAKPSHRAHHSRSKSVASNFSASAAGEDRPSTPPASPGKRFSPTKSTWLESAISKPDSPKPASSSTMGARNSQPGWMADIAKAKAQRASVDLSSPRLPAEGNSSEVRARSPSPTKFAFGREMLRRTESRDLDSASRTASPALVGAKRFSTAVQSPVVPQSPRSQSVVSPRLGEDEPAVQEAEQTDAQPDDLPKAAEQKKPVSEATPVTTVPDLPATSKPASTPKLKPETPPKPKPPQTDFRSNLRSRAPAEPKSEETPEFLSKFGNLRRTTTSNYVAPDVLKNNIQKGKAELTKTSGPVKSQVKDEFKDSLLAKKEQWKSDKEAGVVLARKVAPPSTPQKPEALVQREALGRAQTVKGAASPEKPTKATPEALVRHRCMKEKPQSDSQGPGLSKQVSAPAQPTATQEPASKGVAETSKLAARFNPSLASFLIRGPPPPSSGEPSALPHMSASAAPDRTIAPASTASEGPPAAGAPLEDMRKGRAKGPKRRKGGAKESTTRETPASEPATASLLDDSPALSAAQPQKEEEDSPPAAVAVEKPKPRAPPPGSAASIMMQSLRTSSPAEGKTTEPDRSPAVKQQSPAKPVVESRSAFFDKSPALTKTFDEKPSTPTKSPAAFPRPTPTQFQPAAASTPAANDEIAEFRGFGSMKKPAASVRGREDNKENASFDSPSMKNVASMWGRQSPTRRSQPPAQVQLPSKRDEEAAMRSAGLLASSPGGGRPNSRDGLGIVIGKSNGVAEDSVKSSATPPKPAKSSRIVSGQLLEASPNKSPSVISRSDVETSLATTFGFVPTSSAPLMIDTEAVISASPHQERVFRTVRKTVHVIFPDGTLKQLPEHENYTFFDQCVQLCTHAYTIANGPRKTEIFLWAGKFCSESIVETAQGTAKKLARDAGNAFVHTIRQGLEPPGFLQALGGILITRKGSRENASRQYMLCGRKHLGQIVFDEAPFGVASLCHGFVYLISHPVTLQETKLYLWKGSACSADEISAGRLAAMDLSETGDVIEVDGGAEFASFLRIFAHASPEATKALLPTTTAFWERKALSPNAFSTRLFRIQPAEVNKQGGIFSSIFARRPSWNNLSTSARSSRSGTPVPPADEEVKVEAKEISPFTQSDLEADNLFLLDAYTEVIVVVGPVFATSLSESVRSVLFAQALRFAAEYAVLAAGAEAERPGLPVGVVLLEGVPEEVRLLFRHWDESLGLWGTGGLMAGSRVSGRRGADEVKKLGLDQVLDVVCRSS